MKILNANTWALLLGTLILASCGQNTGPASNQLDGSWKCVQINGEDAGEFTAEYIFAGKKLTIKQGSFERSGDIIKMTAKAFSFRYERSPAVINFNYKLNGRSLHLEPRVEGGQPLTFARK